METDSVVTRKKRPLKRILLWALAIFVAILTIITIYVSQNFNRLLTDAIQKGFNSNSISDVYELKFDKLKVNIFTGNIKVFNVVMQPLEKPLHNYPYINSSFKLKVRKIMLEDVKLMVLIKTGKLELSRIELNKPEIEFRTQGEKFVLFPLKDTLAVKTEQNQAGKKFVTAFSLKEFELIDASFHIINTFKEREFKIHNLNINLNGLKLDQQAGLDLYSFEKVDLSMGKCSARMLQGAMRTVNLTDFKLGVDTLRIRKSIDTTIFTYSGFDTGMKGLLLNTADSIYAISVKSADLSYHKKSISLASISFKSNLSQPELLRRDKFQKAYITARVGMLKLSDINFDTLVYHQKLFVDQISIDTVILALYKDKFKPIDKNRFPQYLGQKIKAIPLPLLIKHVKATRVRLVNIERKTDGKMAKVIVDRGVLDANNITNLPTTMMLTLNASAYIENKVNANLTVAFNYQKPQFSINCKIATFNLPDLNSLLTAYTPAKILKGTADEITFWGIAGRTGSSGTMKFLYHDLNLDLKLKDKANWQNSLISFAANTYLATNNPSSASTPPRIVKFTAQRDMNKGGFNILLRSFLAGMKETMIMSKENKEAYKAEKKKWKLGKK